jgi:hypothetical protein
MNRLQNSKLLPLLIGSKSDNTTTMDKYQNPQLILEIIHEIRNQRKHDKFGIGYLIGMMQSQNNKSIFNSTYLREEVIQEFIKLIKDPEKLKRLDNGTCMKHIFSKY